MKGENQIKKNNRIKKEDPKTNYKSEKKNQIVDQKRIKLILKNIKKKSINHKIDPKITNKIWRNMIYAYIEFERRNFNKKK